MYINFDIDDCENSVCIYIRFVLYFSDNKFYIKLKVYC